MVSGCFGKFDEVERLKEKLSNHKYTHEHHSTRQELIGVVQLTREATYNNKPYYEGVVVDQSMGNIPRLEQTVDGKYHVIVETKPVTQFTRFSIFENQYVVLENSNLQVKGFRVISQALRGTNDFVQFIGFDTQKMFDKFKGIWLARISGRRGNWQSGTERGDDLEDDDAIGRILKIANKTAIGFYTRYFPQDRMQVSVSASGNVSIKGIASREELYQYVIDELAPFMIDVSG